MVVPPRDLLDRVARLPLAQAWELSQIALEHGCAYVYDRATFERTARQLLAIGGVYWLQRRRREADVAMQRLG